MACRLVGFTTVTRNLQLAACRSCSIRNSQLQLATRNLQPAGRAQFATATRNLHLHNLQTSLIQSCGNDCSPLRRLLAGLTLLGRHTLENILVTV